MRPMLVLSTFPLKFKILSKVQEVSFSCNESLRGGFHANVYLKGSSCRVLCNFVNGNIVTTFLE